MGVFFTFSSILIFNFECTISFVNLTISQKILFVKLEFNLFEITSENRI